MDAFFEKVRGYVKMTEDLPFAEFSAYYQDVMAYLQANYQDMDEHALLQAHIICEIVAANADARAAYKDANRKKFSKMAEKSIFWANAIKARLAKEGIDVGLLEERESAVWAEGNEEAAGE